MLLHGLKQEQAQDDVAPNPQMHHPPPVQYEDQSRKRYREGEYEHSHKDDNKEAVGWQSAALEHTTPVSAPPTWAQPHRSLLPDPEAHNTTKQGEVDQTPRLPSIKHLQLDPRSRHNWESYESTTPHPHSYSPYPQKSPLKVTQSISPPSPQIQSTELVQVNTNNFGFIETTFANVPAKKAHRRRPANVDKGSLYCHTCGSKNTPEWRRGPQGPATLCNACGLAYAKRLRQEEESNQAKLEQQKLQQQQLELQQQQHRSPHPRAPSHPPVQSSVPLPSSSSSLSAHSHAPHPHPSPHPAPPTHLSHPIHAPPLAHPMHPYPAHPAAAYDPELVIAPPSPQHPQYPTLALSDLYQAGLFPPVPAYPPQYEHPSPEHVAWGTSPGYASFSPTRGGGGGGGGGVGGPLFRNANNRPSGHTFHHYSPAPAQLRSPSYLPYSNSNNSQLPLTTTTTTTTTTGFFPFGLSPADIPIINGPEPLPSHSLTPTLSASNALPVLTTLSNSTADDLSVPLSSSQNRYPSMTFRQGATTPTSAYHLSSSSAPFSLSGVISYAPSTPPSITSPIASSPSVSSTPSSTSSSISTPSSTPSSSPSSAHSLSPSLTPITTIAALSNGASPPSM